MGNYSGECEYGDGKVGSRGHRCNCQVGGRYMCVGPYHRAKRILETRLDVNGDSIDAEDNEHFRAALASSVRPTGPRRHG